MIYVLFLDEDVMKRLWIVDMDPSLLQNVRESVTLGNDDHACPNPKHSWNSENLPVLLEKGIEILPWLTVA